MNTVSPNRPNMTGEYLRQNRWKVLFEGTDGLWFERNIYSANIPDLTFTQEEWWDGIAPNKLAVGGKFGNVTMVFYASLYADPVYNWINKHLQQISKLPGNSTMKSAQVYKKNILLRLTDGLNNPIIEWGLLGSQIVSVRFGGLSYKSDGDVLDVTLEITSDRVVYPGSSSNALANTPLFSAIEQFTGIPAAAILNNPAGALSTLITGTDPTSNAIRGLLNNVVGNMYGGGTNIGSLLGGSSGNQLNNFINTLTNTSISVDTIGRIIS